MTDRVYIQLSAYGRQTVSLILNADILPLEIVFEQLCCNRILHTVLGDYFCASQYCVQTILYLILITVLYL